MKKMTFLHKFAAFFVKDLVVLSFVTRRLGEFCSPLNIPFVKQVYCDLLYQAMIKFACLAN